MTAVHTTAPRDIEPGFRWVITRDRKRVKGLPAYDSYEEAETALIKYAGFSKYPYFIHREFVR